MSHRLWLLAAGAVFSIGLLWLAARGVSWAEVAVALGSARWDLVAAAVVCVIFATALRAWCWRRLLVATSVPVTFVRAWKILLIGQFLNICVPVRAGDVARMYLMGDAGGMSKTGAATSLVSQSGRNTSHLSTRPTSASRATTHRVCCGVCKTENWMATRLS